MKRTAKIVVAGVKPGTRYHRFGWHALDGRADAYVAGQRAAVECGCVQLPEPGVCWFNAYAHAAASDCGLACHLGDCFYGYAPGTYPANAEIVAGRDIALKHDILSLVDYRLRYASYEHGPDRPGLCAPMACAKPEGMGRRHAQ